MSHSVKAGKSSKTLRRSFLRRWYRWVLASALLIGGIVGVPWWNERPLREADRLLAADDAKACLQLVDSYLKTDPKNSRAIALKARALVSLGDAIGAIRLIDQVGAATPEEMHAYAKACLILERWTTALGILEHLVSLTPDDADLLHELSACSAKVGRYERAIQAASMFADTPGNQARGYALIGMLERDRGNNQKCCDAWKTVVELQPNAAGLQIEPHEFFLEYGKALLLIGDARGAEELLERSVMHQETADALAYLGKAKMQLGKAAEAESCWSSAVGKDSDSRVAREGLAELAMQQAQFAKALGWLKPLQAQSELKSSTAFLLQRTYTLLKDTDNAAKWKLEVDRLRKLEEMRVNMEQVIVNSPESMWAQAFQSYFLAEQGNHGQAAAMLAPFMKEDSPEFLQLLWKSLKDGSPLPALDQVPMELF
ncbi:MAG: hypothetical protein U0996_05800 [Planctomycetaceae bacterium]